MARRDSLLTESLFGEAVVNSDVAAFLIHDEIIIAANDAATRLTGYGLDELVALSVDRLAADPRTPEEREAARAAAARGEWQAGATRIRRRDGETRTVTYLAGQTVVGRRQTFLGLAWETPSPSGATSTAEAVGDWMRTLSHEQPASGGQAESAAPGRPDPGSGAAARDRQSRKRRDARERRNRAMARTPRRL